MRLWSLHPKYLDPQGLVALWREALLAQAVLRGQTRGYRHHPQLERFQDHAKPLSALNAYLKGVHAEATQRGYAFDRSKLGPARSAAAIPVTTGQVEYEWRHLMKKLAERHRDLYRQWRTIKTPELHPLFKSRAGLVEPWERVERDSAKR